MTKTTANYKDWTICVAAESSMCSNFSFDVTDPAGGYAGGRQEDLSAASS